MLVERFLVRMIAGFELVARCATACIDRTHGMSLKVDARSERYSTKVVHVPMARHFDSFIALKNITGQFEVTLIPSCSIKFNKRKFDFGMARKDRFFLRSRTKV